MNAKLICYTLGNISLTKKTQFKRDLFGYKDYSNRGKYNYERKGFLSNIPHYKPIKSVIIIKIQDESKIITILKKYKANYQSFDVLINLDILKN